MKQLEIKHSPESVQERAAGQQTQTYNREPEECDDSLKPLSFTQEGIEQAIAESNELLAILVPGTCRREHVMAFCQQAPIARYQQFACDGGPERNPWDPKSARRFVRLLRAGRLKARTIIQIAYLASIGRHVIRCRLELWLAHYNDKEIDDIDFMLTLASEEACRLLTAGHFGTLSDAALQEKMRQNEMAHFEGGTTFFHQYGHDDIIPSVLTFQLCGLGTVAHWLWLANESGSPDIEESRDLYHDQVLDELSGNALIRTAVTRHTDQEILDIWGHSRADIIDSAVARCLVIQERCDVLGVGCSDDMEGMGAWMKYKGLGYVQV